MSDKPVVRVQFDDPDSYWEVVKTAAGMNLKMPEFLKRAAIKVHNDIVAEQNAQIEEQQRAQEQQQDNSAETEVGDSQEETPSSTPEDTGSEVQTESQPADS